MGDFFGRPSACRAENQRQYGITFENCTGMPEVESQPGVIIFPNPSGGHFILNIHGFKGGSWQLSSIAGTIMERSEISLTHYKTNVDVQSHWVIYILKVQKEGAILVKKIMITPDMGK